MKRIKVGDLVVRNRKISTDDMIVRNWEKLDYYKRAQAVGVMFSQPKHDTTYLVVSDVCPEMIDIGTKIGTKSLVGYRFIKCMGSDSNLLIFADFMAESIN